MIRTRFYRKMQNFVVVSLIPPGWSAKTEHPDLASLTIWAVEARYPSDMPDVVEDDAHKALQMAEAVYQNVANDLHRYKGG